MISRLIALTLILPIGVAFACSGSDDKGTGSQAQQSGDAGATAKIGEPCSNGVSDCMKGLGCDGDDPHGGQCYGICSPHQDSDCGDTTKFACNVEGHCYLRCNTNTDCPRYSEGYVCKNDTPVRAGIMFCDVPD